MKTTTTMNLTQKRPRKVRLTDAILIVPATYVANRSAVLFVLLAVWISTYPVYSYTFSVVYLNSLKVSAQSVTIDTFVCPFIRGVREEEAALDQCLGQIGSRLRKLVAVGVAQPIALIQKHHITLTFLSFVSHRKPSSHP